MTIVCLSFDFDAISSWITNWKQTSPTPFSRGEFAATTGVPRILDLLRRNDIRATFFVPGHTARTFPREVNAIHDAGHEIAAHSDMHATPVAMTLEDEIADFDASERSLSAITGIRPRGYRSPAWDLSANTLNLLEERGYIYDSSLMTRDFSLFAPRTGDRIEPDGTVVFGRETGLVEIPISWELDDYVYFQFLVRPQMAGLRNPENVGQIWAAEYDYCANSVDDGVFTLTMHPEVIGRGPRMVMLEKLIDHMRSHKEVSFETMSAVAERELVRRASARISA